MSDKAIFHETSAPLPDEAQELWEINAGWWQESFTEGADAEYTEQIIPLLRRQLGDVSPVRVLDIGCGEGQLSRVAAGVPGVRQVVGIDPTGAQLAAARDRQPPSDRGAAPHKAGPAAPGTTGSAGPVTASPAGPVTASPAATVTASPAVPQYVRASAGALPVPSASFDAIFACLVFEHIEGTAGALAEVGRALRPGGTFLLFLNHPLLQAPGSGWVDDHILGEQYWRIGPYLAEHHGVEEVDKDVWIPFVHRPLSVYVNAMAAAGLYVTEMLEPPPPPGFLARADEYQQAAAFPRLLVLRAEKLPRPSAPGAQ